MNVNVKPKRGRPRGSGKRGANMPALEKARAAVRFHLAAGNPINTYELGELAGVSHVKIDEAIAAEVAAQDAWARAKADVEIDPASLPKTAKKKLEAVLRREVKRLEDEYDRRFHADVAAHVARLKAEHLPRWQSDAARAKREADRYAELINNHKPLFTEDQFKMILMVMHPDNSASSEKRAEVFRLINAKKLQLTKGQ